MDFQEKLVVIVKDTAKMKIKVCETGQKKADGSIIFGSSC